jgi:hypothetical protein
VFNRAAPRPYGSSALRIEVTGQRCLLQLIGKKRRRIFRENKEDKKLIHGTNTPPGARSSPASPQIDGGWALSWAARARAVVDASTRRPGVVDEACEPIARKRRGTAARQQRGWTAARPASPWRGCGMTRRLDSSAACEPLARMRRDAAAGQHRGLRAPGEDAVPRGGWTAVRRGGKAGQM